MRWSAGLLSIANPPRSTSAMPTLAREKMARKLASRFCIESLDRLRSTIFIYMNEAPSIRGYSGLVNDIRRDTYVEANPGANLPAALFTVVGFFTVGSR